MELLKLTALIVVIFLGVSFYLFKIPPSISKIYYLLRDKFGYPYQYIFTVFMFFVGGMVMYLGAKNESQLTANMFYLGGSFLLFVGVFPNFEDDEQRQHYIMAALGLIITLLAFSNPSNYFYPILTFLAMAGILKAIRIKNSILWIELIFICLTFYQLYLKYS
jgi:hypothetical protein